MERVNEPTHAHTPGVRHPKRWRDAVEPLDTFTAGPIETKAHSPPLNTLGRRILRGPHHAASAAPNRGELRRCGMAGPSAGRRLNLVEYIRLFMI